MEVYVDILKVIGGEGTPTRVMQASNVAWSPFRKIYLPKLIEAGLVVEKPAIRKSQKFGRPPRMTYCLTTEGWVVISTINELKKRFAL